MKVKCPVASLQTVGEQVRVGQAQEETAAK